MITPIISCPIVRVPEVVPCDSAELDALIKWLESDAPATEIRAFARGTALPDGRLDLCKQSLGPRGCARVVAALKGNSHVKSVLLGTDAIGDDGAREVAELIGANSNLEVIYLGCNGISARGAEVLARALETNSSVRGLWLKRNPIGDAGVAALAQMLRLNEHLQILDIVNCGFTSDALAPLVASLRARNRTLRRLYLGGNGLGAVSALHLGEILRQNEALEGLFLNVNDLGDGGARILAAALSRNRTLRELGLGSNGIGVAGLEAICAALSGECALEILDLGRAASQTVLGARGNNFSEAGGSEAIAAMLGANRTLKRLQLGGTHLNKGDCARIFDVAATHPTLCELLVDAPLREDVKARLGRNSTQNPARREVGVDLIKSVYRTAKKGVASLD